MAFLILPEKLEVLGIKEAGVRIKRPGHPRDGALIDGFIRTDLIGEIILDKARGLSQKI